MVSAPAVSIIVPMHNVANFIEPCLRSLAAQTLSSLEIILIDDGSTDATTKVVTSFIRNHPQMSLLRHNTNAGVHAARVTGLHASSGRFVGFVDSDDQVLPRMFETMHAAATEFDADIVVCGASSGPEQTPKVDLAQGVHTKNLLKRFSSMEFGTGSLWNKLFRRITLINNPAMATGACSQVRRSEDYIVNAGAFHLASRVVTLADSLYLITERPGSISRGTSKSERLIDQLRACRIGMRVFRNYDRNVSHALGHSFIYRLSYSAYHPRFWPLLLKTPSLATELSRIAAMDIRVAAGLARRLLSILRNSLRGSVKSMFATR